MNPESLIYAHTQVQLKHACTGVLDNDLLPPACCTMHHSFHLGTKGSRRNLSGERKCHQAAVAPASELGVALEQESAGLEHEI